jgi:hypothetical protein
MEIYMAKIYQGRIPSEDDGWSMVKSIDDGGQEWLVFKKAQQHSEDWSTYKVVAKGKVENKANYWMVKNHITGQIGYPADYAMMRQHRPNLHAQVEEIFKAIL